MRDLSYPLEQMSRKYIRQKIYPIGSNRDKEERFFLQRDIDKAIHSPRKNNPTKANRGKGD